LYRLVLQPFHVVRNVEPDNDDGRDVKNDDPPKHPVDRSRDVAQRVPLFPRRDPDRFGSTVSERGRDEQRGEPFEPVDERCFVDRPISSSD
jgi:hypothetical protein